jgi:hypothetical protein
MTGQGLMPPSQLAHQQLFGGGQLGASPFAIGLPVRFRFKGFGCLHKH